VKNPVIQKKLLIPAEADAVPSKTYNSIISGKKLKGKSGHHCWHHFRPGLL
jgi:hypothetical protein